MSFSSECFIRTLHEMLNSRRYSAGLQYCESFLDKCDDDTVLVEYVRLLLNMDYLDKAFYVLKKRTKSPFQSLNIFNLYDEYYSRSGKVKELEKLHEKHKLRLIPKDITILEHIVPEGLMNQLSKELKYWVSTQPPARILLSKAYNLISFGDTEETYFAITKAISEDPESILSQYLNAEMTLLKGNLSLARKLFQSIIDRYPSPAVIYKRLGDIAYRESDYLEAIKQFQRSLNLDSKSASVWHSIIDCYLKLKKSDEARACIVRARKEKNVSQETLSQLENLLNNTKDSFQTQKVNGLVVFEGGGHVFPIEMMATPEIGCNVTGNMGRRIFESALISYQAARSIIFGKKNATSGIHINIPWQSSYRDGPSAGMAFTIGIISAWKNKFISQRIAFTGEVDLRGNVYPVGGIHNKLLGAWHNNITHVCLPAQNINDTKNLPQDIKSRMTLMYVNNIKELMSYLWKKST